MKKIMFGIAVFAGLALVGTSLSAGTGEARTTTDECRVTNDLFLQNVRVDLDEEGVSEIKGKIYNSSDDDYRSARILITMYDDDGHIVGSETVQVTADLEEGDDQSFRETFLTPDDAERATYEIICAEES